MVITIPRLKKIFRISKKAFGKYGFRLAWITTLGFIGGLLGGFGITAIIPLFALITEKLETQDTISKLVRSFLSFTHIGYSIYGVIAFMLIVFIIKALVLYYAQIEGSKLVADYEYAIRSELTNKTFSSRWQFLLERKIGHLENLLVFDVYRSSDVLGTLSLLIISLTSLLAYTIIAFNISAKITLITLTLGAFLFLLLKPLFSKTRARSQSWSDNTRNVSHIVAEHMIAAKLVKTTGTEKQITKSLLKPFDALRKSRVDLAIFGTIPSVFLEPILLIFLLIILLINYKNPTFDIASFAAIMYLVQKMFSFMQNVQGRISSINESIPYIRNVLRYRKEARLNREVATGNSDFVFNRNIKFNDVSFKYNDKALINNLSFEVKKGFSAGIIGPSGSGKTTIADLLMRLILPTSGSILIDNINSDEINLKQWRNKIGYVSQDLFFLNDTIENNIRFYDSDITEDRIIKAAEMAALADLIKTLPDGYKTVIGERGMKLSAGQRQRITFARILARNPEVLILDEATSALDNESERAIQETIDKLKGEITVIAIAHRLTTIIEMDNIIAIENGKIIEEGSPKKLLADKSSYLYKAYHV